MNLCVSDIAWTPQEGEAAHGLLRELGVTLIELAPTRRWPDLSEVASDAARATGAELRALGLTPVAFQALLFGRGDWNIFSDVTGAQTADYLRSVVDLAAALGVRALVFGSPKNRRRGSLTFVEALGRAAEFFRPLGAYAASHGVCLCIEPNPAEYGCDFMQTVSEAAALVEAVASPGVRLQGDGGELIMNGEDIEAALGEHGHLLGHFHISQPNLASFAAPACEHQRIAAALRACGYGGVVSIEMKRQDTGLAAVSEAVKFAWDTYPC